MINEHLSVCDSTQARAAARLDEVAAGELVVVSASSQLHGRGRQQRTWHDPQGAAVMVSIARRGPLDVSLLEDLPQRVGAAVLGAVQQLTCGAPVEAGSVIWRAPNDLVDSRSGAKIGGILVDAATTAAQVDRVIVGIGVNACGAAFQTPDGRAATSIEQSTGCSIDPVALRDQIVADVIAVLG